MKIFVASTGRCGTKYLTGVFERLTNIPSFHEPRPVGINEVMRDVNDSEVISENTEFIIREKLQRIVGAEVGNAYFEASNTFIKTFAPYVLDAFDDCYCIYLHRNVLDTLISYVLKNEGYKLDWFLQPHWKQNLFRCEPGMSFNDIVIWQWYEVRQRFHYYKDRFVDIFDFDFKDINNLERYYELFDRFKIKAKRVKELPPDIPKNPKVAVSTIPIEKVIQNIRDSFNLGGYEWGDEPEINYYKGGI